MLLLIRYIFVPLRAPDKLLGLFLYMFFYEGCLYWLNLWALFTVREQELGDARTRAAAGLGGGGGEDRAMPLRRRHRGPGGTQYRMREKMFSIGDDFWIENGDGERGVQGRRQGAARPQDASCSRARRARSSS